MQPIRLLVVDDNADFRETVLEFLESQPGLSVVGQAVDGRAAVAKTCQLRPDVVLMDVAMPILNGLEAARLIGRSAPGVRVIMLLPIVSEEYRVAARACGAAGSVAKERVADELVQAIEAATSSRKTSQPG